MWRWLQCFVSYGILASIAFAADKPELSRIFPPGGGLGATVDVEATGKFPSWPIKVWSDTSDIAWTCLKDTGKLQVKIAPNAQVGLHWVRMYDDIGSTAIRPFLVGAHPELLESEPNNSPSEATRIDKFPATVHGILNKRADVDVFAISLKAHQLMAATVDAVKWLQSPADTTLQIIDRNGFVLAENLDHVGLDPYLEFRAPKEDSYFIRIFAFPATPDSTIAFSGGADWNYRLQIDTKSTPMDRSLDYSRWSEIESNRTIIESGKHDRFENAYAAQLPLRVRSTIASPRQSDYFRFTTSKGKSYRVKVVAREFGSSLDPVITVYDATQKQIVQQDDVGNDRDSVTIVKAPSDGDCFIQVSDFHRFGGDRFAYVLDIEEFNPGYKVSVGSDLINATIDKEFEFTVAIDRDSDYKDTLLISIDPLPEGIACAPVESKHGTDSGKKVTLKIKASKGYQGLIEFAATSTESRVQKRFAHAGGKPIWLNATRD